MHGPVPYDPVKAHQYYLRTRQLKGRLKGAKPAPVVITKSPTFTVSTNGRTVRLTAQQLAEQRAYAAKRVSEIVHRLAELGTELRKLKAKAVKAKNDAAKPPTAAAKSKAARASKQYQNAHKQVLATKKKVATKKKTSKADPVAELEKRITHVKGSLIAAVAKQRALTAATKNG